MIPDWSLRASLANLADDMYDDIGRSVRSVERGYQDAFEASMHEPKGSELPRAPLQQPAIARTSLEDKCGEKTFYRVAERPSNDLDSGFVDTLRKTRCVAPKSADAENRRRSR